MLFIALVQVTASETAAPAGPPAPVNCQATKQSPDEILVCGRRPAESPYRLRPIKYQTKAGFKPEVKIADGVSLGAGVEKAAVGGGAQPDSNLSGLTSNQALLRLKIKF